MKKFILILGSCFLMFGTLQAQNCARYVNGDSTKTTAPYSIYREFFKKQLYADALPYWRIIFNSAPAFRAQTMMDGEVMFTNLIQNTTDAAQKDKYADTLMMIYDKRIECHGLADYVLGKKAVDQLKYKGGSGIKDARANFEKSLQISGDNAYPFVIQTYFKLLVNQNGQDDITVDLIKGKYESLSKILDKNIAKNDKNTASNKEVKTLLDDLYNELTRPKIGEKIDSADCPKFLEMYKKKYNENPNDLANIKTVYNNYYSLSRNCVDSAFNVELLKKLNAMEPSYSYAIRLGKIYTRLNKYDSAYVLYENAVAKETDSLKKADLYFSMANIKYEKNDFPASRDFAKQTIAYNPKMGTAYLLIGTLYAASGKLCGPGTGFQSQIILWPAFDYFKKAKEMDPSIAEEAQKMLTSYKQYLPTKAEVTAKKLSVGGTYTVKCWINEETTVQVK